MIEKKKKPWIEAGISKSSWYRYISYYRDEIQEFGFMWLIDKISERQRIKKCLSEASKKIIDSRAAIRINVKSLKK